MSGRTSGLPLAYRLYAFGLVALAGLAALSVTLLETPLEVGRTEVIVVAVGLAVALLGGVEISGRSTTSLIHLPVLAAVYLATPVVAIALAAATVSIVIRRKGFYTVISNAGGMGLSAAVATTVFHAAPHVGIGTDPSDPLWFFAASASAVAFMLSNHALVSVMITLKYHEPLPQVWRHALRPMIGSDLIGSVILIGFVSLVAGMDGSSLRIVAACVAVLSVGLLLALILRTRQREKALAERENALAEREQALTSEREAHEKAATAQQAERVADERAQRAVDRLNDVASGTVPMVVAMIDLRDRYTARHSANVGRLCRAVAQNLGWSKEDQALAHMTGLVHDIGKVGLTDEVLRKPGRPTEAEWAQIQRHPDWGANALAEMRLMGAAVDGVRSHHERWNGGGYPRGLRADDIPVLGRVVAVCDSYDAMIGMRPFRAPMLPAEAVEELKQEAGRLYDPVMVAAILDVLEEIDELEETLVDRGFASEWREACAGLDMEQVYLRISSDLDGRSRIGMRELPSAPSSS